MLRLLGIHDVRVFILALARMTDSIGNSFLVVVLPLFIASDGVTGEFFGLSEIAITGIILSLFGFVSSPLQPLTGRLSDRTGKRKLLVLIGLLVLSLSTFAYVFTSGYWDLITLRVFQGIAGALIIPTTIALVNDLAMEENRGGNMGAYNTFRMIGFGLGPVGAGIVVGAGPYHLTLGDQSLVLSGFEAAFTLAAFTGLLSFGLVLAFVADPEPEPDTGAGSNPTTREEPGAIPQPPPVESTDIHVKGSRPGGFALLDRSGTNLLDPVFALGAASFCMVLGIALFATLGDPINERLNQGAEMFGLQFAAFIIAQVLFQAPIGRLSDFLGRKPFIVWGMVLLIPTTFLQGIVMDSWLMVGMRLSQGIAGAMVLAPALALAGDYAPEGESGGTLSVLTMAFGLGLAFGPLVSGLLVGFGFLVPFAFGSVMALVGLVLVSSQVGDPRRTE